jgi:hypothetical protein
MAVCTPCHQAQFHSLCSMKLAVSTRHHAGSCLQEFLLISRPVVKGEARQQVAALTSPYAPVEGCTMPAVPPMPRTRWGWTGSTPPIGIKQYSSSSIFFTCKQGDGSQASQWQLNHQPTRSVARLVGVPPQELAFRRWRSSWAGAAGLVHMPACCTASTLIVPDMLEKAHAFEDSLGLSHAEPLLLSTLPYP